MRTQNMATAFLDTNILMETDFNIDDYEKIIIAGVTVRELDELKTNKDKARAGRAKHALGFIKANLDKFDIRWRMMANTPFGIENNDDKILCVAKDVISFQSDCEFFSNDFGMIIKGRELGLEFKEYKQCKKNELYSGYRIIKLTEEEMAEHYSNPENNWGLHNNEYVSFVDAKGITVDLQRWTDKCGFTPLNSKGFKSIALGKVDKKAGDIEQAFAVDALNELQFVMLTGAAGSGKTLLSLSWAMQALQGGKIGRIIIVTNPIPLKNSKEIGFLPGTRDEKILGTSLGGILASKLGGIDQVDMLIRRGELYLIPAAEIRGFETRDDDLIFVTEAQNCDAYLMKTILQRAKDKTKIIIEGDILEQSDMKYCAFDDTGMISAINAFKGTSVFGCVMLKNIYRSKVAQIAQSM